MGVVLVLAVGMGCYVRSVSTQQDAVAAIRRAGGSVAYDWRWEGNNTPGTFIDLGRPLAPRWLANLVPADYIATVISVDLNAPARRRWRETYRWRYAGPYRASRPPQQPVAQQPV